MSNVSIAIPSKDGMHVSLTVKMSCNPRPSYLDFPFLAFLEESGLLGEWRARGLLRVSTRANKAAVTYQNRTTTEPSELQQQGSLEHPIVNEDRNCNT